MSNDNQPMNDVSLNSGNVVPADSPVNDASKVHEILEVKHLVLGNARLIYGSEARKFFDAVIARDPNGQYICVLVCSLDGYTRILRKETDPDALVAIRALSDGLIKDAGTLFGKADLGDQLSGQQGFRGEDGKFKLDEYKAIHRFSGPADDTRTLRNDYRRSDIPMKRKAEDVKRPRLEDHY